MILITLSFGCTSLYYLLEQAESSSDDFLGTVPLPFGCALLYGESGRWFRIFDDVIPLSHAYIFEIQN